MWPGPVPEQNQPATRVEVMFEETVEIWTDGACRGNPGVGGWGVLLKHKGVYKELCGGAALTTNNQMELTAAIEGLKALKRPCTVRIHTDSQYVKNGMTSWIFNWQKNGWKTADRKPVKNADLWRILLFEVRKHKVQWDWVKGHAGDPHNEKADERANQGIEKILQS